jgi:hypothetical protein
MGPTLHQSYTVEEAVAAFGGTDRAEFLCDGQFAVLPKVVLCFATLGGPVTEPLVTWPSCLVWRPRRFDYDPSDEVPWLPEKAREVYLRDEQKVEKLRDHHVFVRLPADERYFYAGEAHLGCYGELFGENGREKGAAFSLNPKLPRDVWLRLGGYPGWLVEVNHQTHRLDKENLPAFEQLVAALPRKKFAHLTMTRYEEDSLTVHTNPRRGWLMYQRYPSHGGVYTRDLEYAGDPEAEEVFACACGIDLEFPADRALPREPALRAVVEFFRTGELPRCVHWELTDSKRY